MADDTTEVSRSTEERVEFSVIVPVWCPEPEPLQECLDSVSAQTYDGWELILVADGPQDEATTARLARAAVDDRTRVLQLPQNLGISAASQAGLEASTRSFVALLDQDDVLSPHALGAFAAELGRMAPVDLAYSDEDKIDFETGDRKMPFYKPGFSMERLRCQMYLGHLLVVRRRLALAVGGFRSQFDGAQDHDLALRCAEKAERIVHIPRILYHWRESPSSTAMDMEAKDWAWEAGRRAVADHLDRTEFPAEAVSVPEALGVTKLLPRLSETPPVSVIIPTGGTSRPIHGSDAVLVEQAVASTVNRSSYPDYELVVVLDSKSDEELAERLRTVAGGARLKVVRDRRSFNFAQACNLGAIRAGGEVLVFLNDDTEITMPDWLERLVMYATRPEIGAVGAKLLYGDGRIQHAGVWSRETGPAHRYVGFRPDHPGNFHALRLPQNCLAVTGACLAVERSRFEEVGGFSANYPLAYNDVDLCLKLIQAGYRNVVDCTTEVTHHESSSRNPTVQDWEVELLFRRWRPLLARDPFDNPCNLAAGVDEYPPAPIDIVERKAYEYGELVLSGRSWPDPDFYNLGGRWHDPT